MTGATPAPVLLTLLNTLAEGHARETAVGSPATEKTVTEAHPPSYRRGLEAHRRRTLDPLGDLPRRRRSPVRRLRRPEPAYHPRHLDPVGRGQHRPASTPARLATQRDTIRQSYPSTEPGERACGVGPMSCSPPSRVYRGPNPQARGSHGRQDHADHRDRRSTSAASAPHHHRRPGRREGPGPDRSRLHRD